MPQLSVELSRTLQSLSVKNFRLYFFAQLVSLSGTWMQTVALSWLAYDLTHSGVLLGWVVACQFMPLLFLGVFGGHVADKYSKYKAMWVIQTLSVFPPFFVAAALYFGHIQIWMLIAVGLAQGFLRVFDNPVRQSLISFLVPAETLKNAVSLYSTSSNLARVVGPVLASLLLASLGAAWCFLFNACSFVFVLIMLAFMDRNSIRKQVVMGEHAGLASKLLVVWNNKPLRSILFLIGVIGTFVFTPQVTYPVFSDIVLHGGVRTYGLMLSFAALGSIAGGLYTSRSAKNLMQSVFINTISLGVCFFALSFLQYEPFVFIVLFVSGFALICITASANTIARNLSEDAYIGTTMSLWSIALIGSGAIGNLLVGFLVSYAGVRAALLAIALIVVFSGLAFLQLTRNLLSSAHA